MYIYIENWTQPLAMITVGHTTTYFKEAQSPKIQTLRHYLARYEGGNIHLRNILCYYCNRYFTT